VLIAGGLLLGTDQTTLTRLRSRLPSPKHPTPKPMPAGVALNGAGLTMSLHEAEATAWVVDENDGAPGGYCCIRARCPGAGWSTPVPLPQTLTRQPSRP